MSILNQFRLDGKTALVTGCRRGIGMAAAVALAEAGADIVGVSRQLEPSGSAVEKEITARGRRFQAYSCNFADRRAVHAFIQQAKQNHPRIDVLINNAGTVLRKPAAEYPDQYWDEVIEINLNSQFVLAREFGKEMLSRGYGKIIFTASLLSFQGGITVPSYAAAKGGLATLIMGLANEWASKGVHVNGVAPGYIRTDNTRALQEDPARSPAIVARIPAGRWGEPADLAGAYVFLASPASDYIDGTILTVDGGWMGR